MENNEINNNSEASYNVSEEPKVDKWYQKTWLIIVGIILSPILGAILVALSNWEPKNKNIGYGVCVAYMILNYAILF